MRSNFRVERQKPNAVSLVIRKIAEAGREDPSIVDLFDFAGSVVHRPADVEQDENARVRFTFVELDVQLVAS